MKTKISYKLLVLLLGAGFFSSPGVRSQETGGAGKSPEGKTAETEGEGAVLEEKWTASDTRLANHYLKLLQKEPGYGDVLDLLWDLYDKKEQVALLLDYLEKASGGGEAVPKILYGHLLRKSGAFDEARVVYSEALDLAPENRHALQALAELNDREKRFSKALSLYTRLIAVVPVTDEEGVAMRLRKAELHRLQGQKDEAVATWEELLRTFPSRNDLRSRIVSLLLEVGETGTARTVLEKLAKSDEAREKVDALLELTRLNELVSDFEGATAAAKSGLAILHFRSNDYRELFSRLVQIHERFERLEELEAGLEMAAAGENPTEHSLHDLAEFYRLTANPTAEEGALHRLVERVPGQLPYRLRLTRVLMRNDRYEDAASVLEVAFAGQEKIPLHLILLRARISLNDEDKKRAEEIIEDYVETQTLPGRSLSEEERREIIEFARENYLDRIVENLLSRQIEEGKEIANNSVPLQLARFLHERGRREKARETLSSHVAAAAAAPREKARRLQQVAAVYRDLEDFERALASIEEAISLEPENADFLTTRADLLVDAGEVDAAIEQLEEIWQAGNTFRERADVDQRLFSLLRGHYSNGTEMEEDLNILKGGNIQSLAQYRRMAAAASRVGRPGDEPPPEELMDYYASIKEAANTEPSAAKRYRAAWWALKLQDNQECYEQLVKATAEAGRPMVPLEEMLLELAVLNERPTLMVRHLSTLAEIDPDNAEEYLHRKAEMRFELGFEDEAIRELKELAAKPNASLNTLATLAKVYQRQGSTGKQVEVWEKAYRNANIFEKRRIVKQLSTALIENGLPEEALEVQLDLIERESDELQRRKQLDTQLTAARSHFLLDWLLARYTDFAQQNPFDPFYPEALARIHLAANNEEKAFEQLKKAYYMSGQREDLLDELAGLADELGDLGSAIYYRRQLLAREDGGQLEHWEALVAMLEKDLRVEEADRLRRRLESKFGRDPEFLEELAGTYRQIGDAEAAERTLRKLLSLREWDIETRFRLALLLQSRDRKEEALEHYQLLLEETEGLSYPDSVLARALPLIEVSRDPEAETVAAGSELHPFIFSVEELPFLGGDLQDEIAESLQEPHPELSYLPAEKALIRLRALEQAAVLTRETGTAERWSQEFLAPERPLLERIWVARHTGNRSALARLIEERAWKESHLERFLSCYLRVLCGEQGRVKEWARPAPKRDEGKQPRATYAMVAAFVLLKDQPHDSLLDRDWVFALMDEIPMDPKIGLHFFTELRKLGRYEDALRLGQGLARDELKEQGGFLFALSQVAGWAGYPGERREYLERSLEFLEAGSRNRSDGYFLTALTEILSLLPDDVERERFLNRFSTTGDGEFLTPSDRLERGILIALAGRKEDRAIELLEQLVDRQISVIRPRSADADQVRYEQIQSWQRMSQLLRYYGHRIPRPYRETREALFEALGGNLAVVPRDESILAEYEQYEIDRRVLQLEFLPPREQRRAVAELQSMLQEPDSHLELARSLESVGLHTQAIPVFREEGMKRDRDYAPLQGLFEACNESLQPGPALSVIEQIHAREFPAPPGLTAEYLASQQARFLLHARDLDRLIPLSQPPRAGDGKPPISSQEYIPYRAALIEVYRVRGNHEALLQILREDRERQKIEKTHLLLGARVLASLGREKEALEWLAEVLRESSEPPLEREAILLAASLHERLGWPSPEEVVDLARKSLEAHPANLTRRIAESVYEAGAREEAVSILKLLRRNTLRRNQRSAIAGQLLQIRDRDQSRESLRPEWEGFFRDFVYEVAPPSDVPGAVQSGEAITSAGRFVEGLLPLPGEENADEAGVFLASIPAPDSSRWLRDLLLAAIVGQLETVATSLYSDAATQEEKEQILETLPSFGEAGVAAARSLIAEESRRGTRYFAHQPYRQVLFFAAIGDRTRLLEIHQRLMQEAQSDLFHQTGLDLWFPSLTSRYRFPGLFAALGEKDLALRLYHRYAERIHCYRWHHQEFLESYLGFLIEEEKFEEAWEIARDVFAKTLRVDLRLLVRLDESDRTAEKGTVFSLEDPFWQEALSPGQLALIADWRSALAENREMVDYSDTW